jgi:hypothetical protein
VARWWGACNDAKEALTRCFTEEKKVMRADRQAAAKARYLAAKAKSEAAVAAAAAAAAAVVAEGGAQPSS